MSSPTRVHPLADLADDARRWMFEAAAPLWATAGRHPEGLFAERLDITGTPDDAPRRLFVQARHVFSFCAMGRLGWTGPWRDLAGATVDYLLAHGRRPDGLFIHRFATDGTVLDARADLYDQAFMLFCLAHAGRALGRPELFHVAERHAEALEAAWRHPAGGFVEPDMPRAHRQQNPHMHFLEAFAALHALAGGQRWADRAEDMAALGRDRFIDPHAGAVREYFTDDLQPAPGLDGTIAEPGHCFEWAWLFEGTSARGVPDADISDRLVAFARRHGIDPARGVAIDAVLTDGTLHKATARLWPQTERLKAALARLRRTGGEEEAAEARRAYAGLKLYLAMPVPGTWQDVMSPDGSFVPMPAPGSSLYHITCAMAELVETVEGAADW